MKIKRIEVGDLYTNCYIVINDKNEGLIIDPGDDANRIIDASKDIDIKGILVTHHHFDHIGALDEIEKHYNLKHNEYNIEGFNFEVIKTPGHTSDLQTFYFKEEKIMFCGDFIFKGTIGRYDFEESNPLDMKKSLDEIKKYPDDITLYPGHGDCTILGKEKLYFDYYI